MNIIIFGPPLSGKGTQSKMITVDFGLTHISTGDMLRAEINKKSALGIEAKKYSDEGLLVPDLLVAEIVERLYNNHHSDRGILFDGYPRNIDQAKHLLNVLLKKRDLIHLLIFLKVPQEELLIRAVKRAKDENREDDKNSDAVMRRIEEFTNSTIPAINYLKSTGIKTLEINGNQSIEKIYETIKKELS